MKSVTILSNGSTFLEVGWLFRTDRSFPKGHYRIVALSQLAPS